MYLYTVYRETEIRDENKEGERDLGTDRVANRQEN